jgi:hypothetical protein
LFWKVDKKRIDDDNLNPLEFLNISSKDKNDEFKNISHEKEYTLVLD